MKLQKWDYETHSYKPLEIPDDWVCKTYSFDMDEVVNCPQCGNKFTYGSMYTSLEIHTSVGFGYGVCEQCHHQELERRLKDEKLRNQ